MSIQLQVYSRYGCHLCEDMLEHLSLLKGEFNFEVTEIDIVGNDELEKQYGLKVPVLVCQEREICHYHLDVKQFRDFMNQVVNE